MKKLIRIQSLILIAFTFIFYSSPALAAQIKLAWDANTEPYLTGYKIYWGNASKSYGTPLDVGKVTQFTLTGLTAGNTYFITVTAYGLLTNESTYSNEVSGIATEDAPVQVISPTVTSTSGSPTTTTTTPTTTTTSTTTTTTTSTTKTSWWKSGSLKPSSNKGKRTTQTGIYMVVSETSVQGSPIGNLKKYEVSTAVDPD